MSRARKSHPVKCDRPCALLTTVNMNIGQCWQESNETLLEVCHLLPWPQPALARHPVTEERRSLADTKMTEESDLLAPGDVLALEPGGAEDALERCSHQRAGRVGRRSSGSCTVWFIVKLRTVAPDSDGSVHVETTSIPWVRVKKSLMKNRNRISDFGGRDAVGQQQRAILRVRADDSRTEPVDRRWRRGSSRPSA